MLAFMLSIYYLADRTGPGVPEPQASGVRRPGGTPECFKFYLF